MSAKTRPEIMDALTNETDKIKAIADVWSVVGGHRAVDEIQPGSLCTSMESIYESVERIKLLVREFDKLQQQ